MANFAVAASEEIINKGNELIERLSQAGEKKSDVLNRLFDIVSAQLDGEVMKQGGIDVQALDASLSNIRNMFLAAIGSKEQIAAAQEIKIAELRGRHEKLEEELRTQLAQAVTAKEEAEKKAEAAVQAAAQAEKEAAAAKEQAETSNQLVGEKERTISTLNSQLVMAAEKADGYDALQQSERDARVRIRELEADMDRKLSEAQKDATIELERKIREKERELNNELRKADRENAALQAKIELLEQRIAELSQEK